MSHYQALVLARSGRMEQARTMWERAVAKVQQAGKRNGRDLRGRGGGMRSAFREGARAKQRARAALEFAKGRDVEYAAALALALAGDPSESQRLAADWRNGSRRIRLCNSSISPRCAPFPHSHIGRPGSGRTPATGGSLRLRDAGHGVLRQIRRALYRLCPRSGVPGGQDVAKRLRRNSKKFSIIAASFWRIRSALWRTCKWVEFVLSGEKDKARSAYQDFLTIWKDADPDIPVLKQARAEYGKL